MTISNQTSKIRYTGNGLTTAFSFPFKIFENTELEVYKIVISTSVATLQVLTTDYTVSITENADGGTVTAVVAPTALEEYLIKRVEPRTQTADLPAVSNFPETAIENALDKLTMIAVEHDETLARCLKFSETLDDSGVDIEIPTLEANKFIRVNDDGDGFVLDDVTVTTTDYDGTISHGADASKPASPGQGDIFFATDTYKIYRCNVAGAWSTKTVYGDEVNHAKSSDIASATTTDIGAATGNFIHITGTTTITGFGTVQAGTLRCVRFAGALTLTYNATSLILPGAANIITAADDTAIFVSEGSGNWRCLNYQRASGGSIGSVAFSVTSSTGQDNISNSGSDVTIIFGSEIFDTGSNFASNTFTAPVTGKYQLSAIVYLSDIDSAASQYTIKIVTSNRSYILLLDPSRFSADVANFPFSLSVLADMDANDTATVAFVQNSGTAQTDINTAAVRFTGFLVQ